MTISVIIKNFIILGLFLGLVFLGPRPAALAATFDLIPKNRLNLCDYPDCIAYSDSFTVVNRVIMRGQIANLNDVDASINTSRMGRWQIDNNNDGSIDFTLRSILAFGSVKANEDTVLVSDGDWLLTPGSHRVIYCVDPDNLLTENDETNNCVERIFNINAYILTINKSGTGSGRLIVTPPGIDCGNGCSEVYAQNTRVNLNLSADEGSKIGNWAAGSSPDCDRFNITMNEDKTCNAVFNVHVPTGHIHVTATWRGESWQGPLNYTITGPETINGSVVNDISLLSQSAFVNKPIGLYTITYLSGGPPAGGEPVISPLSSQTLGDRMIIVFQLNFDVPLTISLTASPDSGSAPLSTNLNVFFEAAKILPASYYFWWNCDNPTLDPVQAVLVCGSPDVTSGTIGEYPKTVQHIYNSAGSYKVKVIARVVGLDNPVQSISNIITVAPSPILTITKAGVGLGRVTSAPAGLDCGATCSAEFNQGDEVTLTATPQPTYGFAGWSGACSGRGACAIMMEAAKNVTATFVSPPNPPRNLSAPNWSCEP